MVHNPQSMSPVEGRVRKEEAEIIFDPAPQDQGYDEINSLGGWQYVNKNTHLGKIENLLQKFTGFRDRLVRE